MEQKEYYYVGKIVGTHALKGEVKIYSESDFKEARFKKGNVLFIDYSGEKVEVTVASHREHKEFDLVSFEGLNSINDVEKYVKCELYVEETQLDDLEEDEFYYFELIGCTVLTDKDEELGIVKNVVNYGASDILVISGTNNKEVMIPFVNDFILDVDLETRTIKINPVEGLLGE